MPYIDQATRELILTRARFPSTAGELNYAITLLLREYLHHQGKGYRTINDILGALDGAGKEFYRRVAAPYEDQKIKENGDVY